MSNFTLQKFIEESVEDLNSLMISDKLTENFLKGHVELFVSQKLRELSSELREEISLEERRGEGSAEENPFLFGQVMGFNEAKKEIDNKWKEIME